MSTIKRQKIVAILGPTASGKSDFAVTLAKKFNAEIISADSRQVYQELNIGSNKITETEKQGIKHYLLNVVKPDQEFSLYDWQQKTFQIIEKIFKKNKLPIIGIDNLPISKSLESADLPKKCVMLFGQEGAGMSDEGVAVCSVVLAISQYGSTRSMNASAAGAIAMYAWAMQHLNPVNHPKN